MNFMKSIILFGCISIGLIGCASWHKYSYETANNESAENISPIKVPTDLSSAEIKNYYPIPAITAKDTGKPPSLLPPI
jgi:uncharacterized lipoprotein